RPRVYRSGDLGQALPSLATRLQSTGFQTVAMLPAGSNLAETPGLVQGFQQVLTFPPAPAPLAAHLAMNEVKARLGKNPLFFWLHLPGPGTPYVPPVTDFLEFLSDGHNLGRRLDLPVGDGDHLRDVLPPAAVNGPMRSPSFYLDAYDAALRLMDTGAALVWKRLQEDHLDDGTILAFASVHGEALGEHGFWFCHGFTLHEEELTVPILILGPGIRPRHESHGWISLMDLHPTLLHMVGQPTLSRSVEGSDLTARLTGRGPLPERPHYAALLRPPFSRSVLNQGGMKLILAPPRPAAQSNPSWWSTETHRELYDLVADPLETTSIAAIRGTVSHEMEVWLSRHYPALPGTPPAKDRSRHR
ncbi:MAG: sulfatase-like hydrolase/transferase, partial [Acidobacteriota bacterium]